MARRKLPRKETYGNYIWRRKRGDEIQIYARVGYYDVNGQWKYKTEKAADEDDALERAEKILKSHEQHGTAYIDGSRMTFEQLADWYIKKYVFAPTYEEGQQVDGLRSWKNVKLQAERLKLDFGKINIHKITPEVLQQFKNKRKNIDEVKTATINRDLDLINTMFKKAIIQRWVEESPFARAENLIRKSLEVRRKMTVTPAEEKTILEVCRSQENKYLYPLILTLRDTGARPSEIFPYSAYGVDLEELPKKIKDWLENGINASEQVYFPICWFQLFELDFQVMPLVSLKGQNIEFRFGTMTERLKSALKNLWEMTDKNELQLVFPFKSIKKEWAKVRTEFAFHQAYAKLLSISLEERENFLAKSFGEKSLSLLPFIDQGKEIFINEAKLANIYFVPIDLRIRDWRRIYTTNAQLAGIPEHIAQRILGHKQLKTTFHYTEADITSVSEMSKILDEHAVQISEANN